MLRPVRLILTTEIAMEAETPVEFTRGMRSNGILTGTATGIQAGPPAPEVLAIHLLGWWPKWRRPNLEALMHQDLAATTKMIA